MSRKGNFSHESYFSFLVTKYQLSAKCILEFLNYNQIKNEKGNSHYVLNVIDLVLAICYMGISFSKLKEVSDLVLIVNCISLGRLMIVNLKRSISLREDYAKYYMEKPGLQFKSVHDIKLIIEFCVIGILLVPFAIINELQNEVVIRAFAGVIIFLGFLENTISILVMLFEAKVNIATMSSKGGK